MRVVGECDLANFMFTRTEKSLSELIMKTWTMHNAQKIITEMIIMGIERLDNALEVGTCIAADCVWLKCALELLQLNHIGGCSEVVRRYGHEPDASWT